MCPEREQLDLDPKAGGAAYTDDDPEPELNPDFSRRVVVNTASLDWQPSPEPGVERKRLELIGKQNPRLTTVVRFAPGSRFESHGHDGGEEFLVLKGTFSDKSGDLHAGAYVRKPAGWFHAPWTDAGCELFVKLRQHHPEDKERVVIDTTRADWPVASEEGLAVLPLHHYGNESVGLCRLASETVFSTQSCPGGVEILVIEGGLADANSVYPAGTWLRLPAGARHALHSDDGCVCYLKTGHLPKIPEEYQSCTESLP